MVGHIGCARSQIVRILSRAKRIGRAAPARRILRLHVRNFRRRRHRSRPACIGTAPTDGSRHATVEGSIGWADFSVGCRSRVLAHIDSFCTPRAGEGDGPYCPTPSQNRRFGHRPSCGTVQGVAIPGSSEIGYSLRVRRALGAKSRSALPLRFSAIFGYGGFIP
jgi:hypothetical protein